MMTLRLGRFHREDGVWMCNHASRKSAAREVSEYLMREIGLDETDFRLRDKFIDALYPVITEILNEQERRAAKPSG